MPFIDPMREQQWSRLLQPAALDIVMFEYGHQYLRTAVFLDEAVGPTLREGQARGLMVSDAHLAAPAIEYGGISSDDRSRLRSFLRITMEQSVGVKPCLQCQALVG